MAAILTYAVGDIHGSFTKLADLLNHCIEHCGDNDFRFVFIGDYVDRGPRSRDVVRLLMQTQASAPEQVVCLRGNHEDMLLRAARAGAVREWLANGGDATLQSYGVARAADIPPEHLAWFDRLPFAFSDGKRFFVHAGITPGVPLDQQSAAAMLWTREPFLLDTRDHGQLVVHGHTPALGGFPELRHNRVNLDTGACFGGPLTAVVFDDDAVAARAIITDAGDVFGSEDLAALVL
jgi:diadenosine tetraphosphatase ApaH/serine/threonine PP2A family protein phosphatase